MKKILTILLFLCGCSKPKYIEPKVEGNTLIETAFAGVKFDGGTNDRVVVFGNKAFPGKTKGIKN